VKADAAVGADASASVFPAISTIAVVGNSRGVASSLSSVTTMSFPGGGGASTGATGSTVGTSGTSCCAAGSIACTGGAMGDEKINCDGLRPTSKRRNWVRRPLGIGFSPFLLIPVIAGVWLLFSQ
jgi:hypothetical protein